MKKEKKRIFMLANAWSGESSAENAIAVCLGYPCAYDRLVDCAPAVWRVSSFM